MENNNSWIWDKFELPCYDRKSFYGKAVVIRRSATNDYILESYGTRVAAFSGGKFIKLWNGYSATTMRHVNSFCKFLQIPGGGKSWWNTLPVESLNI